MTAQSSVEDWLDRLAARWRRRRLATATVLLAIALAPLETLLVSWSGVPAWWLPAAAVAALGLGWFALRRRPGSESLLRHLDRTVREVEESSELLLAPTAGLAPLGRLQQEKVTGRIIGHDVAAVPLGAPPAAVLMRATLVALAACFAIWMATPREGSSSGSLPTASMPSAGRAAALGLSAEIRPPDYTGLGVTTEVGLESGLDLSVVEGSVVTWRLEGLDSERQATLVFDDARLAMTADEGRAGVAATRELRASRVYYLEQREAETTAGRTPYARINVVADSAPEIRVLRPEPFVLLPEAGSERMAVVAEIGDDYSVETVSLIATVASGSGELVEFREREFSFPRRDGNRRSGTYARVFDLDELGVEAGAELYFLVQAADNRRPRPNLGRSATHIVRRAGGSAASVGLGEGIPVFAVPDLFRSQRQVILDTERLLVEQESIQESEFHRRSQEIGLDQRALRLRYGVLLGQEFVDGRPLTEEEEALEFEDDEDLGELVGALPEGVVHQHDVQDLNTFFDSEVKERMRTALREMWGAEGRLRSNEPRPALPFEYRALTLLKQAQERSRVYVQKVGFEAPPLYPEEKRLTGELEDIPRATAARRSLAKAPAQIESILNRLVEIESGAVTGEAALEALAAARAELLRGALEASSNDLVALEAAARLEVVLGGGGRADPRQLEIVRGELWRRLPDPERFPGRSPFRASSVFAAYLEELDQTSAGGRRQ